MKNHYYFFSIQMLLVWIFAGSISFILGANSPCLPTWYYFPATKSCYKPFVFQVWANAVVMCQRSGATLTSIHSLAEQNFILDITRKVFPENEITCEYTIWIGMDLTNHAKPRWIDGTPMDYKNWHPDNPSNSNNNENCGNILKRCNFNYAKWNDDTCSKSSAYVCRQNEAQISAVMKAAKITPQIIPTLCPIGWTYFYKTRDCYKAFPKQPWRNAVQTCKTQGGSLTSIHSWEEDYFVFDLLYQTYPYKFCKYTGPDMMHADGVNSIWIGLDAHDHGNLKWVDGSKVDYKNWWFFAPDNFGDYCGQIMYRCENKEWAWNDYNCANSAPFVCRRYRKDLPITTTTKTTTPKPTTKKLIPKPTTKPTTKKPTTKRTTKLTTKPTTKPTTKSTPKPTTRATPKTTKKPTPKPTTRTTPLKPTPKPTPKPTTTKPTTKSSPKPTTTTNKPTTTTTTKKPQDIGFETLPPNNDVPTLPPQEQPLTTATTRKPQSCRVR